MVCDFCSDPNPLFAFPAKPLKQKVRVKRRKAA